MSKAQLTGMRGVYLVAAELARQGFIAAPTSRSAKGCDLLVTSQDGTKAFSVQVKTNATSFEWFMGVSKAEASSYIYVLVNLRKKETEFYVVPSTYVSAHASPARESMSFKYAIARASVASFR